MADKTESLAQMLARPSYMDPMKMAPARPVARSVNPTLQQNLYNLAQRTVGPQWATALEPVIGMLPLVGVEEGYRQARSPDPLTANLGGLTAAAGLMPGLEGAGEKAVVKEGAKAAERAAESYTAEHLNAFRGLANAQRGEPELAMVRAQKELSQYPSGATLGTLMEHVGDLTHRMSQKYAEKMNWGREWVEPKVRNQLLNLQNVVDRDRMAQIPITPSMSRYAEEHAKLPVFNRTQQLSRDAAVALGRKDFDAAERHLTDLRQMLDSPGAYETEASKYDPNFEKSEPTLDQQVAKVVQRAAAKPATYIGEGAVSPRPSKEVAWKTDDLKSRTREVVQKMKADGAAVNKANDNQPKYAFPQMPVPDALSRNAPLLKSVQSNLAKGDFVGALRYKSEEEQNAILDHLEGRLMGLLDDRIAKRPNMKTLTTMDKDAVARQIKMIRKNIRNGRAITGEDYVTPQGFRHQETTVGIKYFTKTLNDLAEQYPGDFWADLAAGFTTTAGD
jgi:hypothetical protein